MIAQSFTPISTCPRCEKLGLHWLRSPVAGARFRLTRWRKCTDTTTWGGVTQTVGYIPFDGGWVDETDYAVIRECVDCAQIWGEA